VNPTLRHSAEALDALVAPPRVLRSEADDQLLHLRAQRWPAGVAVRVGPGACDQPPVPAQQRLRLHKEGRPSGPGQDAADRGKQGPGGGLELRTWGLAAQDGELVAKDEDLQVLGGVTASKQRDEASGRRVSTAPGWPPQSGSRSASLPSRGSNELAAHRPRTSLRTPHPLLHRIRTADYSGTRR
jgi:hypothetical protein